MTNALVVRGENEVGEAKEKKVRPRMKRRRYQ